MPDSPAIALEGVCKRYKIYATPKDRLKQSLVRGRRCYFREHEALKPLTLSIARGETVAVVGRNGSGKSTLLQMICGTLTPSGGQVRVHGRISALLELGAGFDPEFTGHENVLLSAGILGLSPGEAREKYPAIVAFSGLPEDILRRPVKTYSSGMYVRLAFAAAIAVEPDILVVDEALAVGDEAFQRKCYARLAEMRARGVTILFVSHAASAVTELCARAILLDEGELLMDGAPREVIAAYHRFIYATPEDQPRVRRLILEGRAAERGEADAASRLAPESRVSYTPDGGEIVGYALFHADGSPATQVETGETLHLRYLVRFTRAAQDVRFAMFLKTRTGQELAGTICNAGSRGISAVAEGEEIEAVFTFRCLLREGVYFANCGVTRLEGGGDVFIHRVVDALSFRVLPSVGAKDGMEPRGLFDLDIQGELRRSGL